MDRSASNIRFCRSYSLQLVVAKYPGSTDQSPLVHESEIGRIALCSYSRPHNTFTAEFDTADIAIQFDWASVAGRKSVDQKSWHSNNASNRRIEMFKQILESVSIKPAIAL